MARKIKSPVKPPAPDVGADDLAITYPNARLPIAGRALVVREYEFSEGLHIRTLMQPFIVDLESMFKAGSEALFEDILDLLSKHRDLTMQAIAQSIAPVGEQATAEDVSWVAHLSDADGYLLISTWWGVCGPFFLRPTLGRAKERMLRTQFAGAASSSSSSTAASAPSPSSDIAPNDSSSSITAN